MEFHIGLLELLEFFVALIGAGWGLLKLSLHQFEIRLTEKFKALDGAIANVQRLELEVVRADTRNAQMYVTRSEYNDTLKRIFELLKHMDDKLDGKANASECDSKILRHLRPQ